MATQTFTINGLAEVLERDRRTLTKSLRHVPPDEKVRGASRWRLRTVLDALDRMQPTVSTNNSPPDPALEAIYNRLDATEATLRKLPTVAKRRAFAVRTLKPILAEMVRATEAFGHSIGREPGYSTLLADQMFFLTLRGLEQPCSWSQSQCWDAMNRDDAD